MTEVTVAGGVVLTTNILALLLVFIVIVGGRWRRRPARAAYALVFWMFHFGLTFLWVVAPRLLAGRPRWAIDWLLTPDAARATVEATLFLACFLGGAAIGFRRRTPRVSNDEPAPELARVGEVCTLAGVGLFLWGLYVHGPGVLLEPYVRFFTDYSLDFSQPTVLMGFGVFLTLVSGCRLDWTWWPGWLFAPAAGSVFLAGARSAPMFVGVTLLVGAVQRGVSLKMRWLAVAALLTLTAVATTSVSRVAGLTSIGRAAELGARAPLEGLAEIGGSLAPVYAVINNEALWGREYAYGETYIYPLVRAYQRIAGVARDEPETNPRFIALFITRQYGAIGFSTVAEAYANGGTVGVTVFALLWGTILGWLERGAVTPYGRARLGAVFLPMLFNARNSFIFVPAWIGVGLALIAVAYVSGRLGMLRRGPGPE